MFIRTEKIRDPVARNAFKEVELELSRIDNKAVAAAAPVDSVFGRTGAVVAVQADYDSFFLTPTEGDAAYAAISHNHAAGDINSGVLADARIPNLAASKITSGEFAKNRIRQINLADTRSVDDTTSALSMGVMFDFKTRTVVGAPGDDVFVGMMYVAPWSDASGGPKYQLVFTNTDNKPFLGIRSGDQGSAWGSWRSIPTLEDDALITGNWDFDGDLTYDLIIGPAVSTRDKIRLWSSNLYAIGMQSAITYGGLNDFGMTFQFNNEADRGFWWGDSVHTQAQGAMALTTEGKLTLAHSIRVGYGESDVTTPGIDYILDVNGALRILGAIVVTGVVDGRDIATDGIKLDGIEALATADQTAGQIEAIVNHDNLVGFIGAEHLDWAADQGASNIHVNNITGALSVTSVSVTGGVNMADSKIDRPLIEDYAIQKHSEGSSAGVLDLNMELGNSITYLFTENITSVTVSNPPVSGKHGEIWLRLKQHASSVKTITWPSKFHFPAGTDHQMTGTVNAVDLVHLVTIDGGTTYDCTFAQDSK